MIKINHKGLKIKVFRFGSMIFCNDIFSAIYNCMVTFRQVTVISLWVRVFGSVSGEDIVLYML